MNKKRNSGKVFNMQLMPDIIELLPLNVLWQAIEDSASKMFLESKPSFKKYKPITKWFLIGLCLIVQRLH